ncbi:predicted protein [Sclerotinia sclerotiorum 1980 UF-70]|uniref:Uncharacterized protein n=1 Tax=Sclerotinia sclerotiorum (strain ATCC 18683 / 1980 / Ss-1) TaxID=665079 RepID=A7EZY8_SCLS1|nr:predicted protein [Sclerotinia sclerotiorum 1980 UF-70]EDN95030.1 predicted protein [Sclerotinia sclerotiorum 1980 UF-70]
MRFFTSLQLVAVMFAIGSSCLAVSTKDMIRGTASDIEIIKDTELGDIE